MLTYGSVCSGIEAATVAWHDLGWKPAWFSEIEPFPCALLAHHYPHVPNLGDMTKILENEVFRGTAIDLLCGGTPCQSFSVAGLRKGLADPRGNLALHFLALVDAARPRWVVWENVTGALTSWSGPEAPGGLEPGQQWETEETSDFGCFLAGLAQLGYGWAYRVFDAQFFGLAQRRERVFVVGHLGGSWQRAAAVLFERDGLSGNPAPRRETGTSVAALTASGVGSSGPDDNQVQAGHLIPATTGTLQSLPAGAGWRSSADDAANGFMIPVDLQNLRLGREDLAGTLLANAEPSRGGGQAVLGFRHTASVADGAPVIEEGITALRAADDTGQAVAGSFGVRRLMPEENESLQGFKRNYTLVPYRGKLATDGPRYRAIGNSWPIPVVTWIGRRIEAVEMLGGSAC